MNDRTRSRLKDALHAAFAVTEAVPLYDRARIESDIIIEGGYIHQFEVIGEALRVVRDADDTIEDRFPDIHRWIALRHRPIHEYRDVDRDLLWQFATDDVHVLISQLESLLQTQNDDT